MISELVKAYYPDGFALQEDFEDKEVNDLKRISTDPTNQNTVPVLDRDGSPLMSTRPSRARRLIRQGRAEKHWVKGVFCVQMTDISAEDENIEIDGVELNIDPGAGATGLAVTSERPDGRRAHALIELRHRGTRIRNRMDRRRSFRRNRRGRLRNRQPRFDNRTRPEGWLAPSLVTRLANTKTWVRRLAALYPIRFVRVETARFDTQIMQDQDISGAEYQRGELAGWQLRSYIFHRDGAKCAYCGNAKAERYELDHIVPRSRGGANRVSNLVVSCHDCNVEKGNSSVEEFMVGRSARLAAIRAIRRAPLAGATQMNIIVPELLRRLEVMGLPTAEYDAYTTSWTRKRLGVPKTHVNDALCVGAPDVLAYLPERKTVARSTGHGDRQMLRPPDRHGNPRGRGYRAYCALPRQQQVYTACPGHRARRKQLRGMASGDLVRLNHRRHGVLQGYATLDKKRNRVGIHNDGRQVSVKA